MTTQLAARPTLAALNATFRSTRETADFVLTTEYRVGRYGLRISRDGYGSRGNGGKLLHLVAATVITEIKPDYDWRPYCLESLPASSAYLSRHLSPEQREQRIAQQLADHGKPWHSCRQPRVGDVVAARQQCVDQNAVGKGTFEATIADTDLIDCNNCASRIFGEQPEARAKVEATAREERAAAKAKNPPPVCFWCGDRRPRTKATDAGEQLPCSYCKEAFEVIFWVETTGAYCQYHAESFAYDPEGKQHLLALGLEEETRAYDKLIAREGRYAR